MKQQQRNIAGILLILMGLAWSLFNTVMSATSSTPGAMAASVPAIPLGSRYLILAVDMSQTGIQDKDHLILGTDPILLIAKKGTIENGDVIGPKANEALYLFNDLGSLEQLDVSKKLQFDPSDEPFANFLLGFYNPFKKQLTYHSIAEYNVSRIVINKEYLAKEYADDLTRLSMSAGYLVINGQYVQLKVIPMPSSFFDTLPMLPSEQFSAFVKSKSAPAQPTQASFWSPETYRASF